LVSDWSSDVCSSDLDPVDGAALVFKAAGQSVAERFAANDPYVTAGLVTKWTVRKWTVVVKPYLATFQTVCPACAQTWVFCMPPPRLPTQRPAVPIRQGGCG